MIICQHCGNKNKDDAKYCGYCGAELPRDSSIVNRKTSDNGENRQLIMKHESPKASKPLVSPWILICKWASVGLLAVSYFIIVTQFWVTVPESLADYVPYDDFFMYDDLLVGGITLVNLPRSLIEIGEQLQEAIDDGGMMAIGNLLSVLLVVCLACMVIEVACHLLNKKLNFVVFGLYWGIMVFGTISIYMVNSVLYERNLAIEKLSLSSWVFVTMGILLASSILYEVYIRSKNKYSN